MNKNFFYHRNRADLTVLAKQDYMVVVPLAATEQHGPHLPIFTDTIICEHIVTNAVEKAASSVPILMSPILPIGCSEHHLDYGGTVSFSTQTYLQVLKDIGTSLITDGFKKIVFLNAHGGNANIMKQTANDLAVEYPIWTAAASYWDIAGSKLQAIGASEVGMVPGHAGGFETSLILALQPDLVNISSLSENHTELKWLNAGPGGTFIGKHGQLTGDDGFTDIPSEATPEKGHEYFEVIINAVADWLVVTNEIMDTEGVKA